MPVKAKKWIFAHKFQGFPKDSDLVLEEEVLPALQDGEILCEAVYLSVDPYMRPYTKQMPEGITMIGTQVAKITESKNEKFPVGKYVVINTGWRTHSVINPSDKAIAAGLMATLLPSIGDLKPSVGIGILGMPGATAYLGFLKICEPKAGEVVLVNGAAGAVGSVVGQIAKIKGCTVIGYAGSDEKVKYIKELGFDHAFNYKTCNLDETLKQAAPNGIDCYFDNVGGDFTSTVLNHMNMNSRMSGCGAISQYNDIEEKKGPYPWGTFVHKRMKVQGFIITQWLEEWPAAFAQILTWIKEGKLKYDEHVTEGFENMPKAFFGILRGENTGKAVVKV